MNSPTITIRIEPELLKIMNELVQKDIFKNKSSIIREGFSIGIPRNSAY